MNIRPYLKSEFNSDLKPNQFKDKLTQYIEEPKGLISYIVSEKRYQGQILNNEFIFTAIGVRTEGEIEETDTGSIIKLKFISISTIAHTFAIGLFLLAIMIILTVAYFEGLSRIKFWSALLLFIPTALVCLGIANALDGTRTVTMKFLNEYLRG